MEKHLTALQAIRKKCIDCSGGILSDIRNCNSQDCPLHFYRMGHNPNRKGIGNIKAVPPQAR